MSLIKVVGIDLAKYVFSIHGVDEHGKCKLLSCSVYKVHHTVSIMASKFVIPYRQSEK
ncbi:hypothetical protein MTsN2n4_19780 [Pseudoalteromonas sp. MTN2-4]